MYFSLNKLAPPFSSTSQLLSSHLSNLVRTHFLVSFPYIQGVLLHAISASIGLLVVTKAKIINYSFRLLNGKSTNRASSVWWFEVLETNHKTYLFIKILKLDPQDHTEGAPDFLLTPKETISIIFTFTQYRKRNFEDFNKSIILFWVHQALKSYRAGVGHLLF